MRIEPAFKRVVAFVDGQNLFYAAKAAFGYSYPNYDAQALAVEVCRRHNWVLSETRFYTGIPDAGENAFWHEFWSRKLVAMGKPGISVFSRPLRYLNKTVRCSQGHELRLRMGEEKGVDVRIAIDIIRLAHSCAYDVALIFSQDQDLSEAADEIPTIAREQSRWIKIASAFPISPAGPKMRGINGTDWIPIRRSVYDRCLDRRDYRKLI